MIYGDVVAGPQLRVLGAVLEGCSTVQEVADRVRRSRGTAHGCLVELRRLGLIDWADEKAGTIHPIVKIVRIYS